MVDDDVCDECGSLDTRTVILRVRGRELEKTLCGEHLAVLLEGARPLVCDLRPPRRRKRSPIGSS